MQIENNQQNEFVINSFNKLIEFYKANQSTDKIANNQEIKSENVNKITKEPENEIKTNKEEQTTQQQQIDISPELMWEIQYIKWFHAFHKNIVVAGK